MELENLREILKKYISTSNYIEQSIKYFSNKLYVLKKGIPTAVKKKKFIILPYLGTISSKLKRNIKACFKITLHQCNIKIILKSTNQLSSLFHFKVVIPKELRFHTVCKFSCSNCNVSYHGKTHDSNFHDFSIVCRDNNGFGLINILTSKTMI